MRRSPTIREGNLGQSKFSENSDCQLALPDGRASDRYLMKKSLKVGPATFGDGRLTVIAGPCVIESREHATMMARECVGGARGAGLDFVFKASIDKANRSSVKGFRGIGIEPGLEILQSIKEEMDVPVLTDIHEIDQ